MDLRERVVVALSAGATSVAVAARFGVSSSWVRKIRLRLRYEGHVRPTPHPGRAPLVGDALRGTLHRIVCMHPDATLAELCDAFAKKTDVRVSVTTMFRYVEGFGITRKKRLSTPPSAKPSASRPRARRSGVDASSAGAAASSFSTKAASISR